MSDDRTQGDLPIDPDLPIGNVDASGEPLDVDQLIHPEQPPMDDAAGGPQADDRSDIDDVETDDLSVQGGE